MNNSNFDQELNLTDYVNVLRKRQNIVVTFFAALVFIVTVGSFLMEPVYRATTTILIDIESPNVLTTSGMLALESQNYYTYKEYYQSQQEILTSRTTIKEVFNEFDLGSTKIYRKAKDPIEKFLKTVTIEPVRDTRLLELHVENKDPILAADIANRIAEIYVRRNLYYISRAELMNLLKNEYLKMEAKLSEYNKTYKDKYPKMMRLKKELSDLVKKIEGVKSANFSYFLDADGEGGLYTLEALKANNVRIEEPAEAPIKPVRPHKCLNVLLAVIVGIFGGVALAFFFEYLDDTIKNAEEIGRLTAWPFLGGIPEIKNENPTTEVKRDIWTHLNPKDSASESYRSIRTSIIFSSIREHPIKSLLVTSPGPQEGKTTTLCNLGIAMAQSGQRVLLVDADMRRPRLHGIFKRRNDKGLSAFLSVQAKAEDIIEKTDIENVSIVTAGPIAPNPSELIGSHKMKELIDMAKDKFDIILFDTPPIAVVTDAVVLSPYVDGLILVIQNETTSKKFIPRIAQILENSKARVTGFILNKITRKSGNYHYHYYSQYYGKQ